ncbi:major facilitator superfamily domain-containing protein 1-like isoform X2 [Gigantopelta aegis]|nr:major facilitator superfamily domain-containing protein 1-like isoform X2 [Gigantopelta aegis]
MLTFGSYFCFDMPSVLQDQFTEHNNCTNGTEDYEIGNETYHCNNCTDCLGMTPDNYNLLYAIYAWTNAVVVIGAGFLIDKVGNRVGVFLFSSLCVLGSCVFAVGCMMKGTSAMLPLMLVGRLIFGSGNGSLTIVQNKITAFWFRNKELAMAFGITLCFSRAGSVLNFFFTESFSQVYGLNWTLWAGAMLCGLGFASAIILSFLDIHGVKQLGDDAAIKSESKKLKFTHIRHFSLAFWLVVLSIMFFYNGVFPFVADASKFIQYKYGFDDKTSSYIAGAVYDVSLVLSPFLGAFIDIVGKRGYLASFCALMTIPVFGILAFSNVYPAVATVWLGITYSVAAASMWPTIPLVVAQATVGTAMGLTTSVQMIGIGISNLIVGQILGKSQHLEKEEGLKRWKYVMIFLLANVLACVATTVALSINDKRTNGILNISKVEKTQRALQEEETITTTDEKYDSDHEDDPLLPSRKRHTVN